jgi:basic membrane protein A
LHVKRSSRDCSAPDLANITLTSVEKRYDQTILLAARAIETGSFQGGVHIGTLETGEVDLSPFYEFEAAVPTQIKRELDEIRADIIAGRIQTMP